MLTFLALKDFCRDLADQECALKPVSFLSLLLSPPWREDTSVVALKFLVKDLKVNRRPGRYSPQHLECGWNWLARSCLVSFIADNGTR